MRENGSEKSDLSLPDYWSNRYLSGQAGWDNQAPHPFLEEILREAPHFIQGKKVLVIGAGPGHDAHFLAQNGAQVIAMDFSDEAKRRFLRYYPESPVDYRVLDLFDLPKGIEVDTVFEHTLLCAIDPSRYGAYFISISQLLAPGGHYLAILWNRTPAGDNGPPFSISNEMVKEGLKEGFRILVEKPVGKTFPGREGTESFLVAEKVG